MPLSNRALALLVTMIAFFGSCSGVVYRVGNADGWTFADDVDYDQWASTKDFHVGDTLLFAYNNRWHNVLQVSEQDFGSCNTASATTAYTSGSDAITLQRPGHIYFVWSIPGHCEAGRKVDIKVALPNILDNSPFASPRPAAPYESSLAAQTAQVESEDVNHIPVINFVLVFVVLICALYALMSLT